MQWNIIYTPEVLRSLKLQQNFKATLKEMKQLRL